MIIAISLGLQPFTPPKSKKTHKHDQFSNQEIQSASNEQKQRIAEEEYKIILASGGVMSIAEIAVLTKKHPSIVLRSLKRLAIRGIVEYAGMELNGRSTRPVQMWKLK